MECRFTLKCVRDMASDVTWRDVTWRDMTRTYSQMLTRFLIPFEVLINFYRLYHDQIGKFYKNSNFVTVIFFNTYELYRAKEPYYLEWYTQLHPKHKIISLCCIWRLATLPLSVPGVLWLFSECTKLSCAKRTLTSRSLSVPTVSEYV